MLLLILGVWVFRAPAIVVGAAAAIGTFVYLKIRN